MEFTFQLSTQFKATPIGKNEAALGFKAGIVAGINTGTKADGIIFDIEVMTGNRGWEAEEGVSD